jgi:signal transduction histidine kinase
LPFGYHFLAMTEPLPSSPDERQRRLERLERLLACYQKALGHELPNQLVAIQGLLRVLELDERERLGPDGRDYLERLHAAARRAHELARALAELARAARRPPPAEPVVLAEAAREASAEVNWLCPGVSIEYDFPESGLVLSVTRADLRQVLVPLLRFAAQNPAGDRPLLLQVGARRAGAAVEIWVKDNGRGLDAEQRPSLFEPFSGTASPDAGHGLSLFLARQLVESWGGALHYHSEPGRGNTFTIIIDQP